MQGKLNLIIGPMFSGKSTLLLTRYRRYKIAGKNCLLINLISETPCIVSTKLLSAITLLLIS
jgi:thymidine kinase